VAKFGEIPHFLSITNYRKPLITSS